MSYTLLLRNKTTFNCPSNVQFVEANFQWCEKFMTPCLELLDFITSDPHNVSQMNVFSFINFLKGLPIWKYT